MSQVVEFVVCHDDKETAFKANATTHIAKVWKSYIAHRKWSDHEAQVHRMFLTTSQGARLGGTVASNNIKNGDKLWVYQLDPEELCSLGLTDQFGYTQEYEAWMEDDLSYWVDEFQAAIRAGKRGSKRGGGRAPVQPPAGGSEVVAVYDLDGGGKVAHSSLQVEEVADGSGGVRVASLLVFRQQRSAAEAQSEALSRRLTVAMWLWNGASLRITALRCTPLWQVAHAAVILLQGAKAIPFLAGCSSARSGSSAAAAAVTSATADDQKLVLIKSLYLEFDLCSPSLAAVTVQDLRRLQKGLQGDDDSSDDEEDDEDDDDDEDGDGEDGKRGPQVDLDLLCALSAGGALQLAALRGTLGPTHPALGAAAAAGFSRNAVGPLFLAALHGHTAAAQALLAWGADPTAGNGGTDESALTVAASRGHVDVIRAILAHCGDAVVALGEKRLALGRQRLRAARDVGGSRSMSLGCFCACQAVCQKKLSLMTGPGAKELALAKELGPEPLAAAARAGHTEVVRLLLAAGYPADVQNMFGDAPLHGAAARGHTEVVAALLAGGANASLRDLDGEEPLLQAAGAGAAGCCRLLLQAGAQPEATSDLLLAYDEVLRSSGRKFRNPQELMEWFRRQTRQVRNSLLQHAGLSGGCTPLSVAVANGHVEAAAALLDAAGLTAGKAPLNRVGERLHGRGGERVIYTRQ